jgi:hypothetical protein
MQPETMTVVESYNPLRAKPAQCTETEWAQIRPFVLAVAAPLDQTPRGIRPYLTAATALGVWAVRNGFELDIRTTLTQEAIEHVSASRPSNQGTFRSTLRSIAKAHNLDLGVTGVKMAKAPLKAPYTEADEVALWQFARNIGNEQRQISLRALLLLGFGCGLARNDLRGVAAADIHSHRADRHTCIRVRGRCAPVRHDYTDELEWVCRNRPEGWLIGNHGGQNLTTRHVEWVGEREGVPSLSPDRLRATWICRHLSDGVALMDLLRWSGLQGCESLDAYLQHLTPPMASCELDRGAELGDRP